MLSTEMKSPAPLICQELLPGAPVETAVISSNDEPAEIGVISQRKMDLLHPEESIVLLFN